MIDGHCHYSDERIVEKVDTLISEALARGVRQFYLGGTHSAEWARQRELSCRYPGIFVQSYGLHPWWIEKMTRVEVDRELALLERSLARGAVEPMAIGETGLDFHSRRDPSKFELQEYSFLRQMELAQQYRKPLVLHVVKSFERVFELLDQHFGVRWPVPVLLHRYSGSAEQAKSYLDRGAILSYSVELLYSRAVKKLRLAFQRTPTHQLSLETDAPDLDAALLPDLYRWVAESRGMGLEKLVQAISMNLRPFRSKLT